MNFNEFRPLSGRLIKNVFLLVSLLFGMSFAKAALQEGRRILAEMRTAKIRALGDCHNATSDSQIALLNFVCVC